VYVLVAQLTELKRHFINKEGALALIARIISVVISLINEPWLSSLVTAALIGPDHWIPGSALVTRDNLHSFLLCVFTYLSIFSAGVCPLLCNLTSGPR